MKIKQIMCGAMAALMLVTFVPTASAAAAGTSEFSAPIKKATSSTPEQEVDLKKPVITATAGVGAVTVSYEKVDKAEGYEISYATDSNFKDEKTEKTSKLSYTISGLKESTKYYVRVRAYKGTKTSLWSATKSATTKASALAAPAVTLTGKKAAIQVSYKKVTGAEKYEIRYATNADFKNAKTITTDKLTNTISGLKEKTTYYVKVRACAGDKKSKYSAVQSVKTLEVRLAAPTVSLTAKEAAIQVSYKAVTGAKEYRISYSTDPNFKKSVKTVTTTKTSYTITGLKEKQKYYVRVRAYNPNREEKYSKYSATKSVTVKAVKVNAVTGVKVTPAKAKLSVSFKAASGAKGYEVQYSTKKSMASAKTVASTKTKVSISKLKAKTNYYVRVRSYRVVDGKKYYSKWTSVTKVTTK